MGSLRTWTLGIKMSQYVKEFFVSLCLLFPFFLTARGENKTRSTQGGQSHLQQPSPHLDLLTSASGTGPYRTLWQGDTPSQVRGQLVRLQLDNEHLQPPWPHLHPGLPGCWQDPSFWVRSSPGSKNHSRGLGDWGVAVSPLPHLVF